MHFDLTGIDALLIDEFDNFKNRRRVSKIAGLAYRKNTKRAAQIEAMLHYVRERYNGRTVGATATFVPNAIGEMHTVTSQLAPWLLVERGIVDFDSWAAAFTRAESRVETTVEGSSLRIKERHRYTNTHELGQLWSQFIDYKSKSDLPYIPEPPLAPRDSDGAREAEIMVCPRLPEHHAYTQHLLDRALLITEKKVKPNQDNWLLLTHHAREMALDPRLRGLDPSGPTKLDIAADKIAEIYRRYQGATYTDSATGEQLPAKGAMQAVFCDLSTPKLAWNVYDELTAQLVQRGIPRERILRMQDAKNEDEKSRYMDMCNNGEVDVIIGSTPTMGVGVNIQRWGWPSTTWTPRIGRAT
ncbi:hypothetical protein ACFQX6_67095 [Streptosporangium lutulentum]